MTSLTNVESWLTQRLPELIEKHRVPGAAIAVSSGDEVVDMAAGVLSKATGVETTPDSVFLVGSITKLWTATLAMQLVDEGTLDLDAPVREYLPEFRISDQTATVTITVRQLLCHVSGFEGDVFADTGMGDDSLEKAVTTLAGTPQVFAPGTMFSYNNAAFSVLGRIVEVLRRKRFDECLREHLFAPLRLTHAANGAQEAILYRAAVGHIRPAPDADPQPVPVWSLPRSKAPAGSMLAMRPRDLLTFARMHLAGGTTADGTPVLSAASVKAMQERQIELPDLGRMGNAWGLGWEIYDYPGGPVLGHDGGTSGQAAFLRVVPGPDVAVAVLTNGGNSVALYTEIVERVLPELAGVKVPPLPVPDPAAPAVDASRYVGTYSSSVADTVISQDEDGRVWAARTPRIEFAEPGDRPERTRLVAWRADTLLSAEPTHGVYTPHVFLGDDGHGHALYLHTGRADRLVDA